VIDVKVAALRMRNSGTSSEFSGNLLEIIYLESFEWNGGFYTPNHLYVSWFSDRRQGGCASNENSGTTSEFSRLFQSSPASLEDNISRELRVEWSFLMSMCNFNQLKSNEKSTWRSKERQEKEVLFTTDEYC
jgi:hypothetical protein